MVLKYFLFCLLGCLIVSSSGLSSALAASDTLSNELVAKIEKFKTKHSKRKNKIEVAVNILDAQTGIDVFRYNADKIMIPASITKIMTTYGVLKLLGTNYRFLTEVFAEQTVRDSAKFEETLGKVGNLYIRGYGDPSLVNETLWEWTNSLKDLGIKEVNNIIIDDSLFLSPRRALGWESYNAGLSATSLNFNSYTFKIIPTTNGQGALVSATPGVPLHLENAINTALKNNVTMKYLPFTHNTASINGRTQLQTVGKVVLKGSIKEGGAPFTGFRAFPDDPANYYGHAFAHFLKLNGIKIAGDIYKGKVPNSAKKIIDFKSKILAEIISDLNKFSNNFIASQLVYAIGQDDDGYFRFDLGLKRLASVLQTIGIQPSAYMITDGSGLDVNNRLTAEQVAQVLFVAGKDMSISPTFINSLTKFGKSGGTLSKRSVFFKKKAAKKLSALEVAEEDLRQAEESVWAKTGTLTGTSSLAGYLSDINDRRFIFTIIINGPVSKAEAGALEEEILRSIIAGTKI
ncbi:MAG: D-alanyl-D-alanine carboxypeptidase/D-alanyl-D-alanine-endopeptidase [Deltaproteobacteria bacterium]|jgi:D-alanyl-D-alanine carboxypeptidase/D-alanyl-D-alanine-endopeptidase (penicillin-binding protein 4)|nr:D-alanyl-D-alanine carboxypeptidase/D-alanyl-D-alanine-endopeptidase [Deltaproteobacteria bacterium]